jgi:hypothetical protein
MSGTFTVQGELFLPRFSMPAPNSGQASILSGMIWDIVLSYFFILFGPIAKLAF